jgi:type IV secretion system protein VirB5
MDKKEKDDIKKQVSSGYLNGRREFLERYGDFIVQAKNWRLAAMLSMVVAIIMGVGFVITSTRSHVTPYVIYLNKSGNLRDIKLLRPESEVSAPEMRYFINEYINYLFSNTGSKMDERYRVRKLLYETIPPASATVIHVLKGHNPFKEKKLRMVHISYILQHGASSLYDVAFSVETLSKNGSFVVLTVNYKALLNIVVNPPKDMKVAVNNPMGIYVKSFSYTKI